MEKINLAQSYQRIYQSTVQGRPLYLSDFETILESVAGFLIIAGGILAGIAIIVSGVLYMMAGSDTAKVTTAKAWFKNGLIGALILFAVGLIIQTLLLIATDPFDFFR
ncbi:MAG: hypothetical protein A3B86_04275 [Candidatus Yanofskybacteria bacterium RIFCSPHIGHO2_02_FULL_38_22b]|uniref:Uncharacterized protein n=1 Tax=Candidatus Yanofskybacteria bacterium RIFCSPHIGHO2_02_FULL_38_22b TaxID=1802673 RepID=A0A1F8EZL4_9BACT|nr:MAG: hypothetical protein A2816_02045 [Candidatus Yanofskybacteria bacterium RIFCSPHIGHO2_01_FULL_39_44]OGN06305.1 MAG: hypothetical protein A3B86_04275 [Candidatus Yanofskybacteria bacterium RIFCSPHIGHO2_02_FULL_38_22b]OGN19724.1 MAG: hypothetical protein A2910_04010 [Candidatus Yanofskybacteria bacterium RIFCSPLOWO2_01_FULL_39_28]